MINHIGLIFIHNYILTSFKRIAHSGSFSGYTDSFFLQYLPYDRVAVS